MMKSIQLKAVLVAAVFITSCSPYEPDLIERPVEDLPETFSLYPSEEKPPSRWWESLGDSELNKLVEEGLSGNFTIQRAWARLRQVEAMAVKSRAGLYPDLNITADASQSRLRSDNSMDGKTKTTTMEDYAIGLAGSYELDMWGRVRSAREAASLESQAAAEDIDTAAVTVAALIAEHWINIISQQSQKRLLEDQLETNRTLLELVELRFHNSMVSALDVYQQKQTVARVEAAIPLVESQIQSLKHGLALLLGREPRSELNITSADLPEPGDMPATGVPADLLAARPDVRAVGLKLHAAQWNIAAARADRLPAIRITARAGYGSDELEDVFDHWLVNLAGNLTGPIFDGKRREAEVDRTAAVKDEILITYRETVLTAVKEVEDAMIREKKHLEHVKALRNQLEAAEAAFREAGEQYLKGLVNYLPVLTQLTQVQSLQRDLIQRRSELLIYRVGLYRALGGGDWEVARENVGSRDRGAKTAIACVGNQPPVKPGAKYGLLPMSHVLGINPQ